jgi:hypothetical protein
MRRLLVHHFQFLLNKFDLTNRKFHAKEKDVSENKRTKETHHDGLPGGD